MVIKFIFVSESGLLHKLIGGAVRLATHSKYAHVAIGFDDCIIEATLEGVHKSPLDKYNNEPILKIVKINVTEDQYNQMKTKAESHIGDLYSLAKCLVAGTHDLLGDKVSDKLSKIFDCSHTIMCSGLATIVMREGFTNFLKDECYSEITPEYMDKGLLNYV